MTFINERLLDSVGRGFTGGPMWFTRVTDLENGSERRNAGWSMPKHKFTADYSLLNPREQNEVLSAFWVAAGRQNRFRYKDWNDSRIRNQSLGTGNGASEARQLVKTYTFGPSTRSRTITLPIATTLQVTANGSPLSVTVDDETGLITPAATWPSGQAIVVVYCEFDVPVRFGADWYPFTQEADTLARCTVDLLEVPPP